MTSSIYLFPDTNVFLHCEALTNIDWRTCGTLVDIDEIHLLICRPVLQEIDELKYRNDWIGRRANKVYKIARRLIIGDDAEHTISKTGPAVRLREETGIRPSEGLLDYTTSDERIVGCAHAYKSAHADRNVRFLTHDAGAMATARNAGVRPVMVPDEWRAAPPPSAAERRVAELEAEIRQLQQLQPRFDNQFLGTDVDKLEGRCLAARSLTDSEISQLLSQLRSRFARSSTSEWLGDCEEVLRNLHTSIQHQSERLSVEIAVKNQGSVPAKDALIEIVGHGPVQLGVPLDDDHPYREYRQEQIRLPSPPSPFDARSFPPYINSLMSNYVPPPRDPNAFYYKPERPTVPMGTIALECKQWRHESGTEYFDCDIYVGSESPMISARIECRIHAENPSAPARAFIQVQIAGQTVDIAERAAQLVAQVAPRAHGHPGDFSISPY